MRCGFFFVSFHRGDTDYIRLTRVYGRDYLSCYIRTTGQRNRRGAGLLGGLDLGWPCDPGRGNKVRGCFGFRIRFAYFFLECVDFLTARRLLTRADLGSRRVGMRGYVDFFVGVVGVGLPPGAGLGWAGHCQRDLLERGACACATDSSSVQISRDLGAFWVSWPAALRGDGAEAEGGTALGCACKGGRRRRPRFWVGLLDLDSRFHPPGGLAVRRPRPGPLPFVVELSSGSCLLRWCLGILFSCSPPAAGGFDRTLRFGVHCLHEDCRARRATPNSSG